MKIRGRAIHIFDRLHMIHRCWRLRFKSEVPSLRYIRSRDFRGRTLLDIGANKGVYSIYMSRAAGPKGRLIAFEAQPELGRHLADVKSAFGLDNLEIVNTGLSSAPGVLTMRRASAGWGGAGFHHAAAPGLEALEVPVTTLDKALAERACGPVSFVKCDVEGHEFDVFRGGEQMLRRDMPVLLFECLRAEEDRGELFAWLVGLGYDGFFFHVTPEDHASYLRNGRGRYVHYTERARFDYVRPSIEGRNYLFVPSGQRP